MSGTTLKTLSILSFILLTVGMVAAVPGADAEGGSSSNPFTGIDTDASELNARTMYIYNGSSVSVVSYSDDSDLFSVKSVTSGFGLSLTVTDSSKDITLSDLSGTLSRTGTISVVIEHWNYELGESDEDTIYLVVVAASSGSSESSGDSGDSGSSGGSDSSGDSENVFNDITDFTDDLDDESGADSAEEEYYSPWLAVIIIVLVVVLIIWVVKKVM